MSENQEKSSRRALFEKYKKLLGNTSQEEMDDAILKRLSTPVKRRGVIKIGAIFGAGIMLDQLIDRNVPANEKNDEDDAQVEPRNLSTLDTLGQMSLMMGAEFASSIVTRKLGIPSGNSLIKFERIEAMAKVPVSSAFRTTVVAGVYEEALCRLLPNLVFGRKSRGNAWNVGVPSALAFAFAHNIQFGETRKQYIVSTDRLPVPQFIAGLFLHKIFREKNYGHAAFAHAVANALPTALFAGYLGLMNRADDETKEDMIKSLKDGLNNGNSKKDNN